MSAREKSDLPVVAEKRANKAASAAAELVERRGGAKENAELQSTVRTQSREAVSQAQARIREAVTRNRQDKLTALLHHLTIDVLRASFFGLKKSAAPGVDEMTWTEYGEGLEENLSDLHSRVQTGRIERCHRAGLIFQRQMADSGRSASLHWKIRSSRRRWWQS
jgi:RNA-directed DNA polymerase